MAFSAPKVDLRIKSVLLDDERLTVDLMDGRSIAVPLAWYPRLFDATPEQRRNWEIAGGGYGIHWPDVDEDLSTEGLLRGAPAPRTLHLSATN
ncbi:DUF2442 domain-containing protein [Roseomonas genomospecies 6]|uniref:DUF2442 domain-containing protein n=1 Tax=Roseomonas genomospecies 6 TaxID=214106 RepID=A0A9W7NL68_9PROT|nr:DUF2442 domain-containing protein [Roseomonas genomospecies 6]KAA0681885.1 DUF2442 domain-containing protein [Roseomonas genomospecies 6]